MLVPKLASGLCAFGQILSDIKYNYMAACPMRVDERVDLARVEQRFAELEKNAVSALEQDGIPRERIAMRRSMDMRYVGQVHECSVDIGELPVNDDTIAAIRASFDTLHEQLFTYGEPQSTVEIVNIESTVYSRNPPLAPPAMAAGKQAENAIKTHRDMIFSSDGVALNTPVYDGELLGAGDVLDGPAVIEEITTTIVINPGWHARLDASGTYVITWGDKKSA